MKRVLLCTLAFLAGPCLWAQEGKYSKTYRVTRPDNKALIENLGPAVWADGYSDAAVTPDGKYSLTKEQEKKANLYLAQHASGLIDGHAPTISLDFRYSLADGTAYVTYPDGTDRSDHPREIQNRTRMFSKLPDTVGYTDAKSGEFTPAWIVALGDELNLVNDPAADLETTSLLVGRLGDMARNKACCAMKHRLTGLIERSDPIDLLKSRISHLCAFKASKARLFLKRNNIVSPDRPNLFGGLPYGLSFRGVLVEDQKTSGSISYAEDPLGFWIREGESRNGIALFQILSAASQEPIAKIDYLQTRYRLGANAVEKLSKTRDPRLLRDTRTNGLLDLLQSETQAYTLEGLNLGLNEALKNLAQIERSMDSTPGKEDLLILLDDLYQAGKMQMIMPEKEFSDMLGLFEVFTDIKTQLAECP
jgi:hypothetical protein